MQDAEKCWDKEQGGDCGEKQAANYGTSQRSILFAAVAQPKAIGTMPMIMARAVISTGRKRVIPPAKRRSGGPYLSAICSVAKLTTRMLLAVATPMHMIAPISAGTLRRVCVMNRNQAIPAKAAGKRR